MRQVIAVAVHEALLDLAARVDDRAGDQLNDQAGVERAFGFVVRQQDPLRAAVVADDDLPDVAAQLEQRHRDLAGRDALVASAATKEDDRSFSRPPRSLLMTFVGS